MALFVFLMAPAPALSQSDSTGAQAVAVIAKPVGVADISEMSFVWLARPAYPGQARILPPERLTSAGIALMKMDAGSPARIVIAGAPYQTIGLLVGEQARFGDRGRELRISGFTHNGGPMPALDPAGRATIDLGATLRLAANAGRGKYRGIFDVIVTNN